MDYYSWLINIIDEREHPVNEYSALLDKLYSIEFYTKIDMDINRIIDGLEMRRKYDKECGIPFDGPYSYTDNHDFCSVLEMMVALAERMEDILYDPDYGDRTSMWFWLMIKNLGLECMFNDHYDDVDVERTMHIFLERLYKRDGKNGSLWPLSYLPKVAKDMKMVEIWMQMQFYIDENFV